jgi:hypothetical protein
LKSIHSPPTLPRSHAAAQHDDVLCKAGEFTRDRLEMVRPFRKDYGRPTRLQCKKDVIEYDLVASLILSQKAIKGLLAVWDGQSRPPLA